MDCETTKPSFSKFLLKLLVIYIKALLLSVPEFLKWLKEVIVGPKLKNITGQLALITGSSNGIGKAIAMQLAKQGCNIAIANRNIVEGKKTAAEIREKFDVKVEAFQVDVSKHEQVEKLKNEVEKSMGPVDILVNNAGLLSMEISLLEGSSEEIQKIVDVNMTSYFWVGNYFLVETCNSLFQYKISDSSSISSWND